MSFLSGKKGKALFCDGGEEGRWGGGRNGCIVEAAGSSELLPVLQLHRCDIDMTGNMAVDHRHVNCQSAVYSLCLFSQMVPNLINSTACVHGGCGVSLCHELLYPHPGCNKLGVCLEMPLCISMQYVSKG